MNLPSKAVLEFSFLLFVSLLLHFVSSFPFLMYKQLARKEVFPRRRLIANLRAPSSDFTVVERAWLKFISWGSLSNRNLTPTPWFLNKTLLIWLFKLWVLLRFLPQALQILSENLEHFGTENPQRASLNCQSFRIYRKTGTDKSDIYHSCQLVLAWQLFPWLACCIIFHRHKIWQASYELHGSLFWTAHFQSDW